MGCFREIATLALGEDINNNIELKFYAKLDTASIKLLLRLNIKKLHLFFKHFYTFFF